MRFTTVAQLALAAAPALVSAQSGSLGFALGAKVDNGNCKGPSDYAADLDYLKAQTNTTIVRGYSATACDENGVNCCNFAANILPVARDKGFQVIIGIWPDDPVSLQKEKDALKDIVPQFKDVIYAVTVGSESLYRRALTGEQLNSIIGDVRTLIGSDMKVGSADSWNNYTDGAASPLYGDHGNANILLVNAFPYWQGQEISNASHTLLDDLGQAFGLIQSSKPDMEIWVGETGWPSAGTDYEAAAASVNNAQQFWKEGICELLTWGINTFAFEAFDESWKPVSTGLDGSVADERNWGVFTAGRSTKYDIGSGFAIALVASLSSPPALLQEEHHQQLNIASTTDGGSPHSTASSVWTAPSPSQLLDSTSPILPLRLSTVGGPRTPVSSGRHQRTSSIYYTASWGSPYQPPELNSDQTGQPSENRKRTSEELEYDSPIPRLRFKYLLSTNQSPEGASAASSSRSRRRAYASKNSPPSLGSIPKHQGKKPAIGFTEDWIRQYLSGQSNSERGNWWSDDSANSDSNIKARPLKRLGSEDIEDWFDPEAVSEPHDEAESSASEDFIRRRGIARPSSADAHQAGKHRRGGSGFSGAQTTHNFGYTHENTFNRDPMAEATLTSKFASPYPTPMEEIDLNLPEPTADESMVKSPPRYDKPVPSPPSLSTPVGNNGSDFLSPNVPSTPVKSTTQTKTSSPARTGQWPKKRTVWRGRNCVIALPLDESRGKAGGTPLPLTHEQNQERLQSWENDGFDTGGFRLGTASESQSRRVYPSSEDERVERNQGKFSVSIPDRKKWEAYVEQLKEQKLRALGVSFGDEDPGPSVSREYLSMSRQASSHYALSPISPALPTATMMGQSTQLPAMTPITSTHHSRAGSVASPGPLLPGAHARPPVSPLASPFQHLLQQQIAPVQRLINPASDIKDGQRIVNNISSARQVPVQQSHVLHQPQPRAVLAHRLYGDSILGPAENRDFSNSSTLSSTSWTDSKPTSTDTVLVSNVDKPSNETTENPISKLNVEAREFTFGPTSSTLPRNFSFNSGPSVQSVREVSTRALPVNRASSATYGATRQSLNVAAPPFQPKPTLGALPSGSFEFSSAGPTFKQDRSRSFEQKPTLGESLDRKPSAGFKGRVSSAGNMVKPPRKNKAIPIVRPDKGAIGHRDEDDDGVEDESGRITQGIGRQKRLRRGGDDGENVPQFAIPSKPPGILGAELRVEEYEADEEAAPSDKENMTPNNEGLKATVQRLARTQPVSSQRKQYLSDSESKESNEWDPFAFKSRDEAEQFNAALPPPSSEASRKVSVFEDGYTAEDVQSQSTQEAETEVTAGSDLADTNLEFPIPPSSTGRHSKIGSLSATAKSFDYRASATTSFSSSVGAPTTHNFANRESSNPSETYPDPSSSSPHALIESPATTLRPSEVGSFRADIPQPRKHSPYYEGDSREFDALAQASVEEIDDVMEQLNGENSDLGVERAEHIWGRISPKRAPIPVFDDPTPAQQLLPNNVLRSDAPSPSPSRAKPIYNALPKEREALGDEPSSAELLDAAKFGMPHGTLVHRLNVANDHSPSEWDDVLSPAEEAMLEPRTHFFDNRVNDLVGGLLQQRLDPLEKTLHGIQKSLSALATKSSSRRDRQSLSPDVVDSDADDEDESDDMYRPRGGSPKRDRKVEHIKAVVAEVLATHNQGFEFFASREREAHRSTHAIDTSACNEESEITARKAAEDKVRDLEKQLLSAEEEQANLREIAEEKLSERREHDDKHHQILVQTQMRTAMLEGAQETLQQTVFELKDKNAALEDTLAEYRLSSDKWREEINQTSGEKKALSRNVESLKLQMEESMRVREGLRGKFDRLQGDMASAARDIASDHAAWVKKEGDHKVEMEIVAAKLVTEEKARAQLEREVERLKLEEKEAIRLSVVVEETLQAKKELQVTVDLLRQENVDHQQSAAKFENQVQQARKDRSSEVQNVKVSMVTDLQAAQHELKMVRTDLESQLARARQQVENAYSDAADAKVTSTSLLQEAMDAQRATIEDLRKDTEDLVQDRQKRHEAQLDDIRSQHDRALHNAEEDKARTETHLLGRLSLSDAKSSHLQDRVSHLEERLEIAKSAAHAAVQAAQSAKIPSSTAAPTQRDPTPAPTQAPPSNIEKISPQALRESILVLQEQLQQRERTIESLEFETSTFDRSLPTKIKERDSEIAWLRELLSVRVADLQDIISTISSEQLDFDPHAVKDAAIRLKAGLEMELQERERASSGAGQSFPTLASVSAFASPKATQLAAAWGNWRKGKENINNSSSSFGNLDEIAASATSSPSKTAQRQQQGTQSFFAGLMTPPPRQTSRRGSGRTTRVGGGIKVGRSGLDSAADGNGKGKELKSLIETQPPETPTFLREGEYDADARDSKGYFDERKIDKE
ncbi:MAG: hypothetical protein M1812_007801 [Candelaria pacifica]|nr:MAG: hypothetical protein M1812_007801 [Candelaria pacifica]